MRRIISAALILTLGLSFVSVSAEAAAKATAPLEVAPGAPARYTVVRGDTLWDISGKFLKKPWRWPELWRMNKADIKNPHWIYPGQTLVLVYDTDGQPRLCIEGQSCGDSNVPDVKVEPHIYVEPQKKAISSIPYELIRPWLTQPLVMDSKQTETLPHIVAAENDRISLGAGDRIYVTGIKGDAERTWLIYRPGSELRDPDSGKRLGYEAIYVGSARLTTTGDPATLQVTRSDIEVMRNDLLVPAPAPEVIAYMPHAPDQDIRGRVLTIADAVGAAGRYAVISISRGTKDGVDVGDVFSLLRASRSVDNHFNGYKRTYQTPEETNGQVFVFRVFDRVSYALVMNADDPVEVGDVVETP
jgi:hypothetical protein